MTKRCKYCGTKMTDGEMDDKAVRQCPTCGFVEERTDPPDAVQESVPEA